MAKHVTHHRGSSTPLRNIYNAGKAGWKAGKNLAKVFKGMSKKKAPSKKKSAHKKQSIERTTVQSPVEGLSKSITRGPRGPFKRKGPFTHGPSAFDFTATGGGSSTTQGQVFLDCLNVANYAISA